MQANDRNAPLLVHFLLQEDGTQKLLLKFIGQQLISCLNVVLVLC